MSDLRISRKAVAEYIKAQAEALAANADVSIYTDEQLVADGVIQYKTTVRITLEDIPVADLAEEV